MEPSSSAVLPRFCKPITTKTSSDSTAADADWNSLKLMDLSLDLSTGTGSGTDGVAGVGPKRKVDVTAAAALPKLVGGKRIWKVTEVGLSQSFVNGAECVVSFVWSPSKFTLTASEDIPKIRRLSKDMKEYCDTAFPLVRVPAVDDIIFAPFEEDYFRGCVDNVNEAKGEATVLFIDYGDRATVRLLDCREPSHKIMTENLVFGMIFTLNLNAVVPSQLELNDDINKIIDESSMYLHICCCHSQDIQSDTKLGWMGSLCMDLEGTKTLNSVIQKYILTTTSGPTESADAQLSEKLTVTITGARDQLVSKGATSPEAEAADQSVALPSVTAPAVLAKSTRQIDSKELVVLTPLTVPEGKKSSNRTTFHDLKLSSNLKNGAIVRINCFWNDGLVSVYALQDKAAMGSLDELIDEELSIAQSLLTKPDEDEILLTPYDGSHYRGRVIAVIGDTVKLTFVDYGDEVKVNYTELKELTLPIAKHPVYSVKFRMAKIPETKHISENNAELKFALDSRGQIEVTEIKYMGAVEELVGNLWFAKDRTWSDIVLGLKPGSSKLAE